MNHRQCPVSYMAVVSVIVAVLMLGCSGSQAPVPPHDTAAPTVISTSPPDQAVEVAVNSVITATFSEVMSAGTITNTSFTLSNGATGTVAYSGTRAVFTPATILAFATTYTATITTAATDLAGNPLAAPYSWVFITTDICVSANPCTAPLSNFCLTGTTVGAYSNPGNCALTGNHLSYTCDYVLTPTPCLGVTTCSGNGICI